jgi:uncharacterized protein YegL
MYCRKCGKQIKDGAKFCSFCGTVQNADTGSQPTFTKPQQKIRAGSGAMPAGTYEPVEPPKPKKSVLPLIIAAAIIGAAIVAAAVIFALSSRSIGSSGGSSNQNSSSKIEKTTKNKNETDAEEEESQEEEDPERKELKEMLDSLTGQDPSGAYTSETDLIQTYATDVESLIDAGYYTEARATMQRWTNLLNAINGQSPYEMEVEQIDVSAFPRIKVYVRIQDKNTMTAVNGLDSSGFYIAENAGTGFVRRDIIDAMQLNNTARLNICMVGDLSGSMMGSPLIEAKSVMSQFLNSVQSGAGDAVSLITFNTDVSVHIPFTNDINTARNAVNALSIPQDRRTALYDALLVAIQQTAVQDGAKCIIAFTDGEDNESQCSPAAIAELSKRYNIPIFLIGIGSLSTSTDLEMIANAAGGFYRNVNQIGSMQEIYDAIFREQKEMYLVEYETLQTSAKEVTRNLNLDYVGDDVAVRKDYTYTPSVLLEVVEVDASLLNGDYVIPYSNVRYVTAATLDQLTQEQLRLARNEIYARRGRLFNDQYLQSYFNGKSWYHGTIAPNAFSESMFNDYERTNAYFIANYERLKGYIR